MKKFNKFVGVLLALVMVLSLAVTASAEDETYSITIKNKTDGHIYEAYQIVTGDLAKNAEDDAVSGTNAVLSNVQWGANAKKTGAVSEADMNALKTLTTEEAHAYIDFTKAPVATSSDEGETYVIDGLKPGYYLVKDKDGTLNGKDDSYTKYILEVVENSTVSPKSSVPSVQKKVDDVNDSNNTEDEVVWNDSADYDIGDAVPFQLKATLANNVEDYLKYKIVFHDTMSKGLTFEKITKVTVDGEEVTTGYTVDTEKNEDGTTLTITFENIKAQGATDESEVIVEYTAILNENAEIGAQGNPNYVYLEYSNNPNWGWDKWEDKDEDGEWDEGETPKTPENPDNPNGDETGKTPEDKVIVFTYKVIVNKVDEAKKPLAGAGFTLYKYDVDATTEDKWVAVGEELKGEALTTFEWIGLDDGDYKLVETTTPAGYNTIEDILFTISAEHDLTWEDELQTAILTKLDGGDKFSGEVSTGALTSEVENKAGTTLPETGGMGTTLFYAIGGLLVAAAVILLITKKRMASVQ